MKIVLFLLYVSLVVSNYNKYRSGKISKILLFVTALLLTFLLCGSKMALGDWEDTTLDIAGYRIIYEQYDVLEHPDFNMYYLFYSSMYLGQNWGLDYGLWWAIMSILAMVVIIIACRVHNYSLHLFFANFMMYHVLVMYSGLKFFYGFCFLLLAYGFLIKNTHKGRMLFAIFTCIAGGFHMMYYFFLILLIKPRKRFKFFVYSILAITFCFTFLMRVSGTAISYMAPFFSVLDNEHVNRYTFYNVNLGFYIALLLHVIVVLVIYRIRSFCIQNKFYIKEIEPLYYTSVLSLVFCPFYAVALTFMRLITAFSIVVLTAISGILYENIRYRNLVLNMSLLVTCSFLTMKFLTGADSFFQNSILPFFDVF